MAGRPRALFVRNATKRHDLTSCASRFRDRVHLKKSTTWSPAYINETKTPTTFCHTSAHVPEENSLSGGVARRRVQPHQERDVARGHEVCSATCANASPCLNHEPRALNHHAFITRSSGRGERATAITAYGARIGRHVDRRAQLERARVVWKEPLATTGADEVCA